MLARRLWVYRAACTLLIPLLRPNGLQCDLAHDVPGRGLGRGISCGHERERGSGEKAAGGGRDGPAARRSARVHCSDGMCHACRALPYAMTDMGFVVYLVRGVVNGSI